jgi:hypothetical protein
VEPKSFGVALGAVVGSWLGWETGTDVSLASSIFFSSAAGASGGWNRDFCGNPLNGDGLADSKKVEVSWIELASVTVGGVSDTGGVVDGNVKGDEVDGKGVVLVEG